MKSLYIAGALLVAVVFAAITLADPDVRSAGPALDPGSTSADGARAAVLLLEASGLDVADGDVPRQGEVGTLVVLVDDLDDDGWAVVRRFVSSGGDLVVAAPFSPLSASVDATESGRVTVDGRCDIPQLDGVRDLDIPVLRTFRSGGPGCLTIGGAPGALVTMVGDGRVLSVGSAHPFRNDALAEADHAAYVFGAISWGAEPIRILVRAPVGTGSESLRSLVPVWVWAAIAQGAVAFALYALWRAIRLGPPLRDPDAVEVDGTALVRARATLLQRSHADAEAFALVHARWLDEVRRLTGWSGEGVAALMQRLTVDEADEIVVRRSIEPDGDDPLGHAMTIREARRILTARPVDDETASTATASTATEEVDV